MSNKETPSTLKKLCVMAVVEKMTKIGYRVKNLKAVLPAEIIQELEEEEKIAKKKRLERLNRLEEKYAVLEESLEKALECCQRGEEHNVRERYMIWARQLATEANNLIK